MIRKLICTVLIFLLMFGIAACGGDKTNGKIGSEEKTYLIRVGHTLQETTPSHIMFQDGFKKYVEEKSEGRIKVEIYANSALGDERKMIEAAQLGTLEMAYTTTAVLANFDKKFLVFDLPFLFNDSNIARQAVDGELGDAVAENLGDVKLKFLGYAENGFRNITNNKKPIHTPADLKGIKIRTMENPIHMRSFELMGASPTPMAFTELYTGLQQGTVDAQENPVFLIYASKFQDVQKYLSLTGHVYAPGVTVMNSTYWDSLPADLQQIVQDGIYLARDMQRDLLDVQNAKDLEELKKVMEVNELTPEEKAQFVEITKPVYDELAAEIGQDIVNLAKAANETYKK